MPPIPATIASRNNPIAPKVDPEFQSVVAPLRPEERSQLESNIATGGCRDALVVWKGILLDGHNRLEICTRLRIQDRARKGGLAGGSGRAKLSLVATGSTEQKKTRQGITESLA